MPITLPASRWRGRTRREDQLDDAVVLLLDDAGEHPLAVERERHEQEQGAGVRDQTSRRRWPPVSGGWSVAVVSSGAGGRWLRSARTAVSATAAAFASTFVRKTSRSCGRSRSASTCSASSACRPAAGDATTRSCTFASSNGSAARCERGGEARRRRRRHRDAVGLLGVRAALPERGRAADEREHDERRGEEAWLRSRSRISRRATSVIARRPLMAPPARGRARRATAARS